MSPAPATPRALSVEIEGCIEACRRCLDAVAWMREHAGEAFESTYSEIGPHLRHCLDHGRCLLRGLASGVVDYDARDRDPVLEQDAAAFVEALESLMEELRALDDHPSRALEIVHAAAPRRPPVVTSSTLARELVFLSSHTIHHISIASALASARGVRLPERLSVAYSTDAHRAVMGARRG